MKQDRYIGIMSGTSLDGVDVALVDFATTWPNVTVTKGFPFPTQLVKELTQLCQTQQTSLAFLGKLDHQLGQLYANCVNQLLAQFAISPETINAIGCHGQTIYHQPEGETPFTLQIGDANIIAAQTGITTIADFRRRDMAVGGQGAPLVPAFHQQLFASPDKNRVVVNIGGIANITVLYPEKPVIGYDVGPGNLLLDGWIYQHKKRAYDKDANWAKQGQVNMQLLQSLLADPYFTLPYPKSTGRELFNLVWLAAKLAPFSLAAEDVQATLVALTASAIAHEITRLPRRLDLPCELLVCGGGAHNPLIMQQLSLQLHDWRVTTTQQYGIDSDFMEAIAFAWLARQRILGRPSNIPEVTGAYKSVSLGVIYPT